MNPIGTVTIDQLGRVKLESDILEIVSLKTNDDVLVCIENHKITLVKKK